MGRDREREEETTRDMLKVVFKSQPYTKIQWSKFIPTILTEDTHSHFICALFFFMNEYFSNRYLFIWTEISIFGFLKKNKTYG
jgi:hypothetical protein